MPEYYTVNQTTGELNLINSADRTVFDKLVIAVLATDGAQDRILPFEYPYIYRTEPFLVKSICNMQSTVVIAPDIELVEWPVNVESLLG